MLFVRLLAWQRWYFAAISAMSRPYSVARTGPYGVQVAKPAARKTRASFLTVLYGMSNSRASSALLHPPRCVIMISSLARRLIRSISRCIVVTTTRSFRVPFRAAGRSAAHAIHRTRVHRRSGALSPRRDSLTSGFPDATFRVPCRVGTVGCIPPNPAQQKSNLTKA